MMKILVVEDEKSIEKLLKYNLVKEGYSVQVAGDGEKALSLFRKTKFELLLLDLMIPKLDGIELCKIVRKESQVPIIMVTAKKEETERVVGLEVGADDYLTKPFSVRELMARIKSVLRRTQGSSKEGGESGVQQIGKLELDFERYEFKVDHQSMELSSKEIEFLKVLLAARGKVLTREQLLESAWGYDQAVQLDTRTVDQHVARLRNKLGSESKRLITVKNIGYRFKVR